MRWATQTAPGFLCLETVSDRLLEGPGPGRGPRRVELLTGSVNEIAAALDAARRGLDLAAPGHADSPVSAYITPSMAPRPRASAPRLPARTQGPSRSLTWHKLNPGGGRGFDRARAGARARRRGFLHPPPADPHLRGRLHPAAYLAARQGGRGPALPPILPRTLDPARPPHSDSRKRTSSSPSCASRGRAGRGRGRARAGARRGGTERRGPALRAEGVRHPDLDAVLARRRDSFAERVAAAIRASLAQADDKRQESLSPGSARSCGSWPRKDRRGGRGVPLRRAEHRALPCEGRLPEARGAPQDRRPQPRPRTRHHLTAR
ncbi:MAG: hypothetical protein M0C28_24480 [Candidatus Moduliflexus flocculans]|nr:hypothetical protein [Candidatus Moduliflexus flocculans]